jgi:uridine kinase
MPEASRTAIAPEYVRTATSLLQAIGLLVDLTSVAAGERRLVVGIAGESGSGKSITAVSLARALEAHGVATASLHQDDYFFRPPRVNHAHRERDLGAVGPHEVNLALLQRHVADFRAGRATDAPLVDYPSDSFLTRRLDFAPLAALVVEGTYVLMLDDGDAPLIDVRVFLEATHDDTAERRRARNRDIDAPFVQDVLRLEHAIVARQAAVADLIVDRDFLVRSGPSARPATDAPS